MGRGCKGVWPEVHKKGGTPAPRRAVTTSVCPGPHHLGTDRGQEEGRDFQALDLVSLPRVSTCP